MAFQSRAFRERPICHRAPAALGTTRLYNSPCTARFAVHISCTHRATVRGARRPLRTLCNVHTSRAMTSFSAQWGKFSRDIRRVKPGIHLANSKRNYKTKARYSPKRNVTKCKQNVATMSAKRAKRSERKLGQMVNVQLRPIATCVCVSFRPRLLTFGDGLLTIGDGLTREQRHQVC